MNPFVFVRRFIGTTAKLRPNTLVIADQRAGPLAMADIFGGQAKVVLMLKQQGRCNFRSSILCSISDYRDVQRQYGLHPILRIALDVVLILRYNVTQWKDNNIVSDIVVAKQVKFTGGERAIFCQSQ